MKWVNYFFNVDFTDSREFLMGFEAGMVINGQAAETLKAMISSHDRFEEHQYWHARNDRSPYDLAGITVVYNGPNKRDFPTNFRYDRVIKLSFPQAQSVPDRDIYLQYNIEG